MKIGILTFQNTLNYGAKFQEFALQEYINNIGADVEVIDYINEKIEKKEKPLKLKEQKSIKGFVKYILLHKYQINKLNKFNNFTKKYVKKSEKTYNKNNISEVNSLYDKIIVGSDQIWNTNSTADDYTYYLDFLEDNSKKSSYAASFGYSVVPERNKEDVGRLLAQFKDLNVREEAGRDIVTDLTKRECNVVVDPTFLLNSESWKKMIVNEIVPKEDYLVAYMVNAKDEIFQFIDEIAEKENLKIVYISDFMKKHNKGKVHTIHDASPEEFISLFNNAKYIVTGSFHAICVSIILNKNFFYMLNDNNVNSRITNLVKIAGLEDRLIVDKRYSKKEDIDYKEVEARMKPFIEESQKILIKMIGDNSNDKN